MKIAYTFFFFFFFSLISTIQIHATVFIAVTDGDWDEPTTWDQGSVPGLLDFVIIDGYSVNIDTETGDVTVKNLILINISNINDSELKIDGLVTVTVTDNFVATSENVKQDIEVQIQNGAILNVQGNVEFIRSATNSYNKKLLLKIKDDSRVNVSGDFIFDYKNADSSEDDNEIFLDDTAILDVAGNTAFDIRNGNDFDFEMQGSSQVILRGNLDAQISGGDKLTITIKETSHFQVMGDVSVINSGGATHAKLHAYGDTGMFTIGGNLTMNSTLADKAVYLEGTKSGNAINVRGDIVMSAMDDGDVYIDLKSTCNLYIGGNFFRPTNYGALLMSEGSTLTFNGTLFQEIAAENLIGSGIDAFNYTNVVVDNSAGLMLEDTVYVTENLNLTTGKIISSPTNILIVEDQATITGGNENAYIEGPMIKKGSSNGNNFVFPIGNENTYAPIEISAISDSSSEYMAQYFGDPPPFGNNLASNVGTISEDQYWELSKTPGSENVNVTLHWMDASAISVNDLNSLIVAGLNEANIWESFGNGGTTGSTGPGAAGSVSSTDGDPPPFGVEKYTIGNSSEIVSNDEVSFNEKLQILSIYPNPVDKTLHLKGVDSMTEEGIMEVFGLNGQRIYKGNCIIENGRFQIATNAINIHTSGNYILRFTSANGSHVLKFNKR